MELLASNRQAILAGSVLKLKDGLKMLSTGTLPLHMKQSYDGQLRSVKSVHIDDACGQTVKVMTHFIGTR